MFYWILNTSQMLFWSSSKYFGVLLKFFLSKPEVCSALYKTLKMSLFREYS